MLEWDGGQLIIIDEPETKPPMLSTMAIAGGDLVDVDGYWLLLVSSCMVLSMIMQQHCRRHSSLDDGITFFCKDGLATTSYKVQGYSRL